MGVSRQNDRGSILILTLWVLALLTLMAYGLIGRTRMGLRAAAYDQTDAEADFLLAALARHAAAQVKGDANVEADYLGEAWGLPYRGEASALLSQYEGVDATKSDFVILSRSSDELGKINVNLAPEELLVEVLREAGAEAQAAEIAAAIVDWRDPDDSGVAEADLYSGMDPAYAPANKDFTSLEELLFVHGVTPSLFFGEDTNHNGRLDSNEDDGDVLLPWDNADGRLQPGLCDLLTVYGDGTINANGASEPVFRTVFRLALGDAYKAADLARAVVARRRGRDGEDGTEDDKPFLADADIVSCVSEVLGQKETDLATELTRSIGVTTDFFRFFLRVEFPDQHLAKEAELVLSREEDALRVLEWHES